MTSSSEAPLTPSHAEHQHMSKKRSKFVPFSSKGAADALVDQEAASKEASPETGKGNAPKLLPRRASSRFFRNRLLSRALSTRKSIAERITKSQGEPQFGSRVQTGPISLKAKERVLLKYPDLAMQSSPLNDRAYDLVYHGPNSVRAEVVDMNCMLTVMEDNMVMLTHKAVQRFFDWLPIFIEYLERYMTVEDDFIVSWVEQRADTLKGELRPSSRMMLRGKLKRCIEDLKETEEVFTPRVPAGQKLPELLEVCDALTQQVIAMWKPICEYLPELIKNHFTRSEIDRVRAKIVKHLVMHIGYKDFVVLYTRWMRPADLLEWKATVLLPCDFKFFSYATWEKEMENMHYCIAAKYGEILEFENDESKQLVEESKVDFERAQQSRIQMAGSMADIDGLLVDVAEEEAYVEGENCGPETVYVTENAKAFTGDGRQD